MYFNSKVHQSHDFPSFLFGLSDSQQQELEVTSQADRGNIVFEFHITIL